MRLLTRLLKVCSWSLFAPLLALLVGVVAASMIAFIFQLAGIAGTIPTVALAVVFLLVAIIADKKLSAFAEKKGIY